MPRLGGLNHHLAPFGAASGASGHLHHQLKGPFGGPEIGVVHQVVGIEDAHQRDAPEIESLGNHLRTDQNVGLSGFEVGDDGVEGLLGSHAVAVQPRDTRFGENPGNLLLDLLRPEAHRNHVRNLARRAFRRDLSRVAAIVADEFPPALVVGQRDVAMGTAGRPAALGALDIGREAAAVLEQHYLLAPVEGLADLVQQEFVEMGLALAALGGPQGVGNEDLGRPGVAVTLREFRPAVLARRGVEPRFERRRGAAQQRAAPHEAGHHHGAVAGVVARRRLGLLVAGVVLLVDDNELQPFQRQEDRRADPDDELAPLGAVQPQVGLRAAAVGEFRMVGCDTAAEDALHARDELGREGDLGNQQQHVAAARQHFGDQVDVDFGLARAGDSLQQGRGFPGGKFPAQRIERRLLVGGELRQPECRAAALDGSFTLGADDQFLTFQSVQHGVVGPEQAAGHLARRDARLVAGRSQLQQRFVLFRSAPLELLARLVERRFIVKFPGQCNITFRPGPELVVGKLLLRVARRLHQRRQRHAHHLAHRTHVVRGDPLPERHLLRREQGCVVKNTVDGFDPFEIGLPVVDPPHDARIEFAGTELHRHGLPGRDRRPLGHGERIGRLRQRKDYVGIAEHQPLPIAWNPLP